MSFEEWWKSWTVKDWNDIESAKGLFQQAYEAGLHTDIHTDNSAVIAELENKIADIKANCDLAIEGRDVKVMELEKENERLTVSYETLKLHDEEEIGMLKSENAELKEQISTKNILIKELQEQKVYWKESSFDWRHKFFKLDKVKRLIKKDKQLNKAKEHIRTLISCLIDWVQEGDKDYCYIADAEQFLNSEVEK